MIELFFFTEIAKLRKSFLDYLLTVQRVNPTELTDDDLVDEIQAVLLGVMTSILYCFTSEKSKLLHTSVKIIVCTY